MTQLTPHILLIEDNPDHVELIHRAFDDHDLVYLTVAGSLADARACLAISSPTLIIADWRLPDGESLELLENPEGHTPPMVIMTSYGNEWTAVNAMNSGALDYVVKSPETMLDMPHIAERAIQRWNSLVEQERMRQALRENEAQFRLLAENSTDIIARLDTEGRFIYVSPACRKILGYAPEEIIGQNIDTILYEPDIDGLESFLDFDSWTGKTLVTIFRLRNNHGEYLWLEATASIIIDEHTGQPVEIQASARDISKRRMTEENLSRAHADLQDAYEKTIEGWVRALDLRDHETEGHTQRVTELTVRMAAALGFPADQAVHIRRGALLHDIGKIGVPDKILLKPGPLDAAEWEIMRRHPVLAKDLLEPIEYLRPAVTIPYYHHEHWDGTGYPESLCGDQIPLEARLFAVIDVWDALLNDRPYRKALPESEVLAYLREQSGKIFDPRIVDLFCALFANG